MAVPARTLHQLRRLASQVGGVTDDAVRAIAGSWLASWTDLTPAWQAAISAVVDRYQRAGTWPAPWQIARIEAVARATDRTARSLTELVDRASTRTAETAAQVSDIAARTEPLLIASQSGTPATDLRIPEPAVAAAVRQRTTRITGLHAAIRRDATIGRALARLPDGDRAVIGAVLFGRVQDAFDASLVRAVTVARTEPIDSARTAAQLVDVANPSLVSAWCWICQCDRRSCIGCWAMHGSRHPMSQAGPEGHGGCRCQRLPLVGDNSVPSAERRFRRLSRRDQKTILGPGRFDLFRNAGIGWADLAVRRGNTGWRDSYVPRPVADLRRLAATRI